MMVQRQSKDGVIRLNTDNNSIVLSVSNRNGSVRNITNICFNYDTSPAVYKALESLIEAIEKDNVLDGQDLK